MFMFQQALIWQYMQNQPNQDPSLVQCSVTVECRTHKVQWIAAVIVFVLKILFAKLPSHSSNICCPRQQDGGNKVADIDSSELEQKFLDNAQDVVDFKAGSQTYSLNFECKFVKCPFTLERILKRFYDHGVRVADMQQTNKQYGTKKNVKRRPRFVSAVDVKATTARYDSECLTSVLY